MYFLWVIETLLESSRNSLILGFTFRDLFKLIARYDSRVPKKSSYVCMENGLSMLSSNIYLLVQLFL
jgi:hypothetical protein